MTKFELEKFIAEPSVEYLEASKLTKDDWINLAIHYEFEINTSSRKAVIVKKVINALIEDDHLDESALKLCDGNDTRESLKMMEMESEKVKLERDLEMEKMKDRENERRFQLELLVRKANVFPFGEDNAGSSCRFDVGKESRSI